MARVRFFTLLLFASFGGIYGAPVLETVGKQDTHHIEKPFGWLVRFLSNSIGYLAILLPLLALRAYLSRADRINRLLSSGYRCLPGFVRVCFTADVNEIDNDLGGLPPPIGLENKQRLAPCLRTCQTLFGLDLPLASRTWTQYYLLLGVCAFGLQISYVLWGIMQERIMTRAYGGEMFGTSQYLVFCNRLATVLFVIPLHFLPLGLSANPFKDGQRAPLFEFSFASVSNILSSWCQYEALKYVSFPTQVLSKACKVIPVMLMGKFIQKRSYSASEYVTAGMVSIGLSMFLLSNPEGESTDEKQSHDSFIVVSGTFLIVAYMLLDSFTSNWQDRMFQKYSLSPLQVMAAVNFWSVILTLIPLIQQGTLFSSLQFGYRHPEFNIDVLLSATCSATGQLFIFLTIRNFGPATFVLIMTLRMALSILLSCLLFGHPLSPVGIFGVVIVFVALFLRSRLRSKRGKNKAPVVKQTTVVTSFPMTKPG